MGMIMGFLFMVDVIMVMGAVLARMLVGMLIRRIPMGVRMAVFVPVGVAVAVLVFMAVGHLPVGMFMFVPVGMFMLVFMGVLMIALHGWPPFPRGVGGLSPGYLKGTLYCRREL